MSPYNKISLNRHLTNISHIQFWRGESVSRQSLSETEFLVGFKEASYTILSLVVSADSLIIGLLSK